MKGLQLVAFRAYADLKAETQRTYLGFLWWILEPLLFLAVFYVVLVGLRGTGGKDFVAFLLVGLVIWQWFKSAVSHSANAVLANLYLMRQVRISPWVFPVTVVVSDTVKFALLLLLLLLMLPLLGFSPRVEWFSLIPILVSLLALIVALGMISAALVPFVPDLRFVIEALLHALLFMSGVFFSLGELPEPYRDWLSLNPIAALIHQSRVVLIEGRQPEWMILLAVFFGSTVLIGAGVAILRFGRRSYPKLAA